MFWMQVEVTDMRLPEVSKRDLRNALRRAGRDVQKEARRMVARRAISQAGAAPGRITGALQKSIGLVMPSMKQDRQWVKIYPLTKKITPQAGIYYPAMLYYGSKKRNIEPRSNYMVEALNARRSRVRSIIAGAIRASLEGR